MTIIMAENDNHDDDMFSKSSTPEGGNRIKAQVAFF